MVTDVGWKQQPFKVYNKRKLHDMTYYDVKEATDLRSQHIEDARDRASEAIKGCVDRMKKHKKTSKPVFTSNFLDLGGRTLTVWFDKEECSFSTIGKRIKCKMTITDKSYHDILRDGDWKYTDSVLKRHEYEKGEPFYLHLGLKKDVVDIFEKPMPKIMGIDLGIINLAVTSTGKFFSGSKINHIHRQFEKLRGSIQRKGTRSAHILMKRMKGRENRCVGQEIHIISNEIVEEAISYNVDIIAFEDLTDIRDNMPNGKSFHSWAFRKLYEFVFYKAREKGIDVRQFNPKYTSQKCSRCGFTHPNNRNKKLRQFKCLKCNYEVNDDYNASKNIGFKYYLKGLKSPQGRSYCQLALKSGTMTPNGRMFPTAT